MTIDGLPIRRFIHNILKNFHFFKDTVTGEEILHLFYFQILVGHLLCHEIDILKCFIGVKKQKL